MMNSYEVFITLACPDMTSVRRTDPYRGEKVEAGMFAAHNAEEALHKGLKQHFQPPKTIRASVEDEKNAYDDRGVVDHIVYEVRNGKRKKLFAYNYSVTVGLERETKEVHIGNHADFTGTVHSLEPETNAGVILNPDPYGDGHPESVDFDELVEQMRGRINGRNIEEYFIHTKGHRNGSGEITLCVGVK